MTSPKSIEDIEKAVTHARRLAEVATPLVNRGSQSQERGISESAEECRFHDKEVKHVDRVSSPGLVENVEASEINVLETHACHGPGFIHREQTLGKAPTE
jgi:hypothetical protein